MKHTQLGFNLISLMVGMTLSLISVLAMLSLYRNMVSVSVQSIQDSRQDGQIAAALLTAKSELQNAGFWINSTDPALKLKLLYSTTLTGTTLAGTARTLPTAASGTEISGNALLWIYQANSTATPTCAGLLLQNGKLLRLQASSCSTTGFNSWSGLTWSSMTLIESNQTSDFKLSWDACWPFGKTATPTDKRVKVTLTGITSAQDADSTVSVPTYVKSTSEVCLPNLAPST